MHPLALKICSFNIGNTRRYSLLTYLFNYFCFVVCTTRANVKNKYESGVYYTIKLPANNWAKLRNFVTCSVLKIVLELCLAKKARSALLWRMVNLSWSRWSDTMPIIFTPFQTDSNWHFAFSSGSNNVLKSLTPSKGKIMVYESYEKFNRLLLVFRYCQL